MSKQAQMKIDIMSLLGRVRYSLKYVDYTEGQWTAPVLLTADRLDKFIDDYSVEKIKLLFDKKDPFVLADGTLVGEMELTLKG